MANHKSAKKRVITTAASRLVNRYNKKSTNTAIKKFKALATKDEAVKELPNVVSMVDKLAKKNNIHKNKAARLKSQLMTFVNGLQ